MTGFGFSRRYKLIKTDEFSSVFSFRKRLTASYIVLHYQPNQLGYARLGLVVAKKVVRSSVQRNYMRRVLRELFRINKDTLGGVDLLIRPQKLFRHQDFALIKLEFNTLIHKLNIRIQASYNHTVASAQATNSDSQ